MLTNNLTMDNQQPRLINNEEGSETIPRKGSKKRLNQSFLKQQTLSQKGDIIIYYLKDPRNNEIRYIGKTTEKDFRKRYISHIFEGNNIKYRTHKSRWIRGILLSGNNLIMEEVDRISFTTEWEWIECFWIAVFKSWGFNLLNMTDGGEGNQNQQISEESKKIRNNKLRGRKRTPAQCEKLSKAKLGVPNSKAHNEATRRSIIKLQGKPVNQYDLNGNFIQHFECVIDAAIYLGNRNMQANIHKCCRIDYPKYKTCYGFVWKYSDNEDIVQST